MISRRGTPGLLGLVLLTSLLPLLLTSCQYRPRADLVVCNGAEPQTLDPALVSGQLEGRLCSALYEGLTRRNARGKSIPAAAESWDISPDGKIYTFHLRPNLRWSNGQALTSRDYRYSWLRALDPKTASPYAEILFVISQAEAFHQGTASRDSVGLTTPDDLTLRVTLNNPTPYFPSLPSFTT